MKKIMFATTLALACVTAAHAVEVGVSGVRDNNLDRDGVRVEVAAPKLSVGAFTPTASITNVEHEYTRYAVGVNAGLFNVGSLAVDATAAGVYQNTRGASNGYGVTVGLKGTLPITKAVNLTAGVERIWGQDRVSGFDGTVGTVGLNVKF
jgi:hypothetical protein